MSGHVIPAEGTALARFARAVGHAPWSWMRWAGVALGFLAGSVLRIRRAHVEAGMRRAGLTDVPALARAMYASLGTAAFEFLWLAGRGTPRASGLVLGERASAVLAEHGREARRGTGTRGLVVATAHTGNWDFVACALSRDHLDLSVVTKRLSAPWLDRFWQERRASFGVELLHGAGVFRRAVEGVQRGRAVALLIDQVPERRSAVTEFSFLGQRARCDTTAALLAARTGAPLVLALGRRLPDGRHWVDVPLILHPPRRASRRWVEDATRALNLELERFVLDHPSQWLWMHRRWKVRKDQRRTARTPASPRDWGSRTSGFLTKDPGGRGALAVFAHDRPTAVTNDEGGG